MCLQFFKNFIFPTSGRYLQTSALKNSQDLWNILFFRRNIEARSQKNTKLYHNRPGEKTNRRNFQLGLHDDQICYVSINLCHQYRVSVAEAQTSLGARSEERLLYSLANNLQAFLFKANALYHNYSELYHYIFPKFSYITFPSSCTKIIKK